MELADYNGWENKFTWLVHLHLSNEQSLMNEIVGLVVSTSDDRFAGLRVKWWIEDMVKGWIMGFPGREASFDEQMRLLVWDVAGTALAYADWDVLVKLLIGQAVTDGNPFTRTLHKSITTMSFFHQPAQTLLQAASSPYAYADALQGWFREQIDAWMDVPPTHRSLLPALVMLVHTLIQNTYAVVSWEHVARAFRLEE
ncbi:MAG: hypothetical protein ACR2H5_12750 [Ktedonobacteraceae bacterium]